MVGRVKSSQQGLRTPTLGNDRFTSPRKKSPHKAHPSSHPSNSPSPPLPIHFLPTPLSTSSGPSVTTTHSVSAASAAASAAGYSPTTASAPGGSHFGYGQLSHFPPAFAARPPPPYSAGVGDGKDDYKGKGKAVVDVNGNGNGNGQVMTSVQGKERKSEKDGYGMMGLGYEGTVPLNDTYGYRRDVKYGKVDLGDIQGPAERIPEPASVQYRDVYANRHKRAASDAAGTTYSCPAGLIAHHYGVDEDGGADGDGQAYPHGPNDSFPSSYNGPSQASHVEIDVTDSASNAPFLPDNSTYTPRSPYRPGEYSYTSLRRSTRGGVSYSERTSSRIERQLFSRDDTQGGERGSRGRDRDEGQDEEEQEQEQEVPKRNRGSSPLQPPFEARLFLRAGASVDVISWLRKNFHYIPSAAHSVLTPSTSLLAIRALIAERFPRLPEPEELIKAVTVAFPRSSWDYPANASEPPMIRGLVWNGKELEVYDEDEEGDEEGSEVRTPEGKGKDKDRSKGKGMHKEKGSKHGQGAEAQYWRDHHKQMKNKRTVEAARASANAKASVQANIHVRAPDAPLTRGAARSSLAAATHPAHTLGQTASTPHTSFESPSSSSKSQIHRNAPATPARSVLDDFAELATLADKSPSGNAKARSVSGAGEAGVFGMGMGVSASAPGIPMRGVANGGGAVPPAPAFALASICDSFEGGNSDRNGFGGAIGALAGDDSAGVDGVGSGAGPRGRKRKSTGQYHAGRGDRDASPDRLSDLLAAAQAVDDDEHLRSASAAAGAVNDFSTGADARYRLDPGTGGDSGFMMRRNSSNQSTGHKRRRTIGGMGPGMREMLELNLDAQHPPPAWAHRPYGALFGQAVPMSRSGSGAGGLSGQYAPNGSFGWKQGQGQGQRYGGDVAAAQEGGVATASPWSRQLASLAEVATPKKDKDAMRIVGGKKDAAGANAVEGAETGSASDVDEGVVKRQFAADAAAFSMSAAASASRSGPSSASASQASLAVPTLGEGSVLHPPAGAGRGKEKGGRKKAVAAAVASTGAGQEGSESGPLGNTAQLSHTDGYNPSISHPTTLHNASSTTVSSSTPIAPGSSGASGPAGNTAPRRSRKANELPTEGDAPGIDCKPPYPYHEMIRYAIQQAPDCRLQLSQIYSNIAERFPFFKTLDEKKTAGWQNSIRHNLSLKKMFVRVSKEDGVPDEGGKGGWWTVKMGVPDEGRPGRKGKGKRKSDADSEVGTGAGAEHGDGYGEGYAHAPPGPTYGAGARGGANADAQAELRAGLAQGGRMPDGRAVEEVQMRLGPSGVVDGRDQ